MSTQSQQQSLLVRTLLKVPVVSYFVSCIIDDRPEAIALFVANCVMVWLLALMIIGWPALIASAEIATASMFVILIRLTRG